MNVVKRIWSIIKPARKYFYVLAFLSLVASLEMLLVPYLSKNIFNNIIAVLGDKISSTEGIRIFVTQILLMAGIEIFAAINASYVNYNETLLVTKVETTLRSTMFKHLSTLSIEFFETEQIGRTINKISRGISRTNQFLSMASRWALSQVITFFVAIVVLFLLSPWIGLAAVITSVIFSFVTTKMSKMLKPLHKDLNRRNDKVSARTVEIFSNIHLVRSFGNEEREVRRYIKQNEDIAIRYKKRAGKRLKYAYARNFIQIAFYLTAYTIACVQIIRGDLTPGDIILVGAYIGYVQNPMWNFAWFIDESIESLRSMEDFVKLLDMEPNVVDIEGARKVPIKYGEIEFREVSFSYKNKGNVIDKISFNVKPGETVALVGPSGVGKSTIIKLISRFYDPSKGKVLVDGNDLSSIDQNTYRRGLGVVQQNVTMFNDTLRNNITYGKSRVSERELKKALKVASLDDFVNSMPKKLNTLVGEKGIKLSGGEAQRVSIARALLHDPKIIILDEATSSLDSKNERMIQIAISRLTEGRTTVIIAHRLSTIMKADKILVLENGKIIESGNHEELMKNKSTYAELFNIQSGAMLISEE